MLPDLPELKNKLRNVHEDFIMEFCYRNFHMKYTPSVVWEGNVTSVNRQDAEYDQEPMFSAEATVDISPEKDNVITILGKLQELGRQMAEKVEPEIFRRLNTILEKYGQVNNTIDRGFKFMLLETFDKLDLPLDENGKIDTRKLTIVIHPDQSEQFKQLIAEAEADVEFIKEYEALILKKQKEADERQNNRKLVR